MLWEFHDELNFCGYDSMGHCLHHFFLLYGQVEKMNNFFVSLAEYMHVLYYIERIVPRMVGCFNYVC